MIAHTSDEPRTGTESDDEFYDALEVSSSVTNVQRASVVGVGERRVSVGDRRVSAGYVSPPTEPAVAVAPVTAALAAAAITKEVAPGQLVVARRDRLPSDKRYDPGGERAAMPCLRAHMLTHECGLWLPYSPTRPSLWAVLKNSIGKDLSKMSLPIIFNEPLSALQRWCLRYTHSPMLPPQLSSSRWRWLG